MGRNRRERREAQATRALREGDPSALLALAEKSPQLCAEKLAHVGAKLPEGTPSELDAIAIPLCGKLRRSGELKAAERLASAFAHRSPRMRLEGALCAFGQGNDAEAARLAAGDPVVASVIAPLLEATEIAAKGAPAKHHRPTDERSPALRALHLLAEAAQVAGHGDTRAVNAARARLQKAAAPKGGSLPIDEMRAALDTIAGNLDQATATFASSTLVRTHLDLAKAALRAIALRDARVAHEEGRRLGFPANVLGTWGIRASERVRENGSPEQRALDAAASDGALAFAAEHRAAASIYEGFACAHTDRKRAAQAFDRAVALGGDLLEALRGKLLLAMQSSAESCPDCGHPHEDAGDDDASSREAALAADRFARAARRVPDGRPFAAMASIEAAEAWIAAENEKAALASIEAAREASNGAPALRDRLTLLEADARSLRSPERSMALLTILPAQPRPRRGMNARIDLAHAHQWKRPRTSRSAPRRRPATPSRWRSRAKSALGKA
ncbi:MAG: hypothetical protein R3B70_13535 [Polyangiaceae bacterium]